MKDLPSEWQFIILPLAFPYKSQSDRKTRTSVAIPLQSVQKYLLLMRFVVVVVVVVVAVAFNITKSLMRFQVAIIFQTGAYP
jgi:hypothetical protein